MLVNDYSQFMFLFFVFVVVSYRTFIAWFKPEQHRLHLESVARLYRRWSPSTESWVASTLNFWITRFTYLFGLVIIVAFLLDEISLLFR